MTRARARGRPRGRSLDYGRLWWLLTTEAAFQIVGLVGQRGPTRRNRLRAPIHYGPTFAGLRLRARWIVATAPRGPWSI